MASRGGTAGAGSPRAFLLAATTTLTIFGFIGLVLLPLVFLLVLLGTYFVCFFRAAAGLAAGAISTSTGSVVRGAAAGGATTMATGGGGGGATTAVFFALMGR